MDVRTKNDYKATHRELISFSTDTESVYNAVRADSLRILYVSLQGPCYSSGSLSPVFIADAGFRYQDIPYEICDGRSGKRQVFLRVVRVSSIIILLLLLHTHPHLEQKFSVSRTNGRRLESFQKHC